MTGSMISLQNVPLIFSISAFFFSFFAMRGTERETVISTRHQSSPQPLLRRKWSTTGRQVSPFAYIGVQYVRIGLCPALSCAYRRVFGTELRVYGLKRPVLRCTHPRMSVLNVRASAYFSTECARMGGAGHVEKTKHVRVTWMCTPPEGRTPPPMVLRIC